MIKKDMQRLEKSKWFAWKPVKLTNGKWVWLKTVTRTVDYNPEHYLGLLPEIYYDL